MVSVSPLADCHGRVSAETSGQNLTLGSHLDGSANDGIWDNAVIPTWPVDRPLPAEADASVCVLDRRRRAAAVAPGFSCP